MNASLAPLHPRATNSYNTFPLMGGQVVPPGYRMFASWWRDAIENAAAAQFYHRVFAITTAVVLLLLARAARGASAPTGLRYARG